MIDYLERALAAEADGVLPVANESGSAEWRGAAVGSAEPRKRAAEAAAAPTPTPAAQTEAEGFSAERRMGEGVDWEEAPSVWTGPRQEELVRAAARVGWPEQVRQETAERVPWAEAVRCIYRPRNISRRSVSISPRRAALRRTS